MESSSQSTAPIVSPEDGDSLWQQFTRNVTSCASAEANNTFACLRSASSAELLRAYLVVNPTPLDFKFVPIVDGKNGLIPEVPSAMLKSGRFLRIPFIAGTNLDEGEGRWSLEYREHFFDSGSFMHPGTLFIPSTISSTQQDLLSALQARVPMAGSSKAKSSVYGHLLRLYPDDPVLGSPFGTGNETFGLAPQFKRAAAIVGDVWFGALRRAWINAASSRSVKTYGYLFTEPQATTVNTVGGNSLSIGMTPDAETLLE